MIKFSSMGPKQEAWWMPTIVVGGTVLVTISGAAALIRLMRRYQKDMKEVRANMDSIKCQYLNHGAVRLQYMERNPDTTDMTCVVLHPSGGGCDQGLLLGELLLPENVRIVAPSRVGYLNTTSTTKPNEDIDKSLGDEAEALMELLKKDGNPNDKVMILACSVGGILGLELARRYPHAISHVVLLSAVIPYTDPTLKPQVIPNPPDWVLRLAFGNDFVKWMAIRLFPSATMASMFGQQDNYTPSSSNSEQKRQQEKFLETMLPARERFPGFVRDLKAMQTYSLNPEQLASMGKIPTLFLASKSDLTSPLEYNRLPKQCDNVTEIIQETGTHMLLNDIDGIKKEIQAFLSLAKKVN